MSTAMRVISQKTLREFWEIHPDAEKQLRLWYRVAKKAEWNSISDVHTTFPSADGVTIDKNTTLTVFNICGNKYRLFGRIRYDHSAIAVRTVLTHTEYDKNKWKE